jgi:hypothetical protein
LFLWRITIKRAASRRLMKAVPYISGGPSGCERGCDARTSQTHTQKKPTCTRPRKKHTLGSQGARMQSGVLRRIAQLERNWREDRRAVRLSVVVVEHTDQNSGEIYCRGGVQDRISP